MTDSMTMIFLLVFFVGFVWGLFTHWIINKGNRLVVHDEHESESVG